MEDVGFSFVRLVLQFFKWLIIDAFIEFILYGYGYLILKLITFGKYPKANCDNYALCITTGLLSVVLTIASIAFFNGYSL